MKSQKSNELFHCDFRMLRKLVFPSSLRSILKNPSTTHIKPHHSLYGELGGLCAVRAGVVSPGGPAASPAAGTNMEDSER
jgi:hypothetical protein